MAAAPIRPWLIGGSVVLLAFVLRCHRLGEVNYWFDETFSIRMAQFSVRELTARCAQDTHPPLFFLALKPWISTFGTLPWSVRVFPALWSLGAVACAFGFVYEALSTQEDSKFYQGKPEFAAGLAALCLALSPLQLTWAHQVRMYAPVACLSVLTTWLLWRAVQRPGTRLRWLLYALAEIVGLYTHVTMMFVFAGHLCFLACVALRRPPVHAATSNRALAIQGGCTMAVVGLFWMPWFTVVRSQHSRVHADFWSEPFEWKLLGEAFVRCFSITEGQTLDPNLGFWIAQGVVLLVLMFVMGRQPFELVVSLTAILPFVGLIAVSILSRNILHGRYFIAGQTLVCLVAAVGVARLPSWLLRIPAAIALIGIHVFLAWNYFEWREEAARQPGVPGLLQVWNEHRAPDEPLIFCSPMFYTTALYYTDDPSQLKVFGSPSRYPFFVGTAIMSDGEYLSVSAIDASKNPAIWTCDSAWSSRFLQPVPMPNDWKLVAETRIREFNGALVLRHYERRLIEQSAASGKQRDLEPTK